MLDQFRHSGVQRSPRLHAGFCARCMSVSGPYWLASLLVSVMHAVVCVLRYSWSFFSPCVCSLDVSHQCRRYQLVSPAHLLSPELPVLPAFAPSRLTKSCLVAPSRRNLEHALSGKPGDVPAQRSVVVTSGAAPPAGWREDQQR